jgi:hypothetical protein
MGPELRAREKKNSKELRLVLNLPDTAAGLVCRVCSGPQINRKLVQWIATTRERRRQDEIGKGEVLPASRLRSSGTALGARCRARQVGQLMCNRAGACHPWSVRCQPASQPASHSHKADGTRPPGGPTSLTAATAAWRQGEVAW